MASKQTDTCHACDKCHQQLQSTPLTVTDGRCKHTLKGCEYACSNSNSTPLGTTMQACSFEPQTKPAMCSTANQHRHTLHKLRHNASCVDVHVVHAQ